MVGGSGSICSPGGSALASGCLTSMQTIEEGEGRRREGRKVATGWTRGSLGRAGQAADAACDRRGARHTAMGTAVKNSRPR